MVSRRAFALAPLAFALVAGTPGAGATNLRTFTIQGVGTGTTGRIEVFFNPKEYTITKSTPWKHHKVDGQAAPTLEFTTGEPYRLQVELYFDTYEEGTSVRAITDAIERLAKITPGSNLPPVVFVTWGGRDWTTRLLEAETEILDVSANGTPLAAVMRSLWSAFDEVGDPPPPPDLVPAVISTPDGDVPLSIDGNSIELLKLGKNDVVKSRSVEFHPARCLVPRVDFVTGDPQRLRMTLHFDTSDEKSDVRARSDVVLALAKIDLTTLLPPPALVEWGGLCTFDAVLESFSLRFTLSLDDGTPVRAVMNTVWKEYAPAEKQKRDKPRH